MCGRRRRCTKRRAPVAPRSAATRHLTLWTAPGTGGLLPARRRLRDVAQQSRPDRLGDAERQAAPDAPRQLELGIRRIDPRHVLQLAQDVLIVKRRRLEAHVDLEVIRAGAAAAAAEVEAAATALDGRLHEVAVHDV